MDDTCVICGDYVPEGRQVCPSCEKGIKPNPARKCYDCKHYKESYFCGYISSHCEVFGSLDVDQRKRHPDITGSTCPRWELKEVKK